jgi:hypothetical protein
LKSHIESVLTQIGEYEGHHHKISYERENKRVPIYTAYSYTSTNELLSAFMSLDIEDAIDRFLEIEELHAERD